MNSSPTENERSPSRRATHARWLLLAIVLAGTAALWWHGPIAQWASYHAFADAHTWHGIPNAANVLSNLPFAFIGLFGLWRLWPPTAQPDAGRNAWRGFSAAVAFTALGSALYHWSPTNPSLVLDRLPIAWACAALLCALLAERVDTRWGSGPALAGALAVSSLSVGYWWATEQQGHGDLRAYLWIQFLPMVLAPVILGLKMPPTGARAVPAIAWWSALALYGCAKLMEVSDSAVLTLTGCVSGHTLKHLLAAAGAAWLLRAASRTKHTQLR